MQGTAGFIHELTYRQLPPSVVGQARRCLLDLIGVAAAGLATDLSGIARRYAVRGMASGEGKGSRILFDGRRASAQGAAFAGAATIDSFDAHDGHRLTKGHAGAAILPALLAYCDENRPVDGAEFLANLVMGYEIGTRAGIALHAGVCDYHTSGAWNALACAAIGARLMGLDEARTRHALGIAEYHGPRSQMMRCIDHPTMVKDGSAFGALAGVSAAFLAADGFTGAPALTVEDPSFVDVWSDLGERWRIVEQYLKPYPVCRWAQPAVEAALDLKRKAGLAAGAIQQIRIHTFHEATRLAVRTPASTEEAQYSTPFPVAAALVHGYIGAEQITGGGLSDPDVLRLSRATSLVEDSELDCRFPAERWARVDFLVDGEWIEGAALPARGDPERPLDEAEVIRKFRKLAVPVLGEERGALIEASVATLGEDGEAMGTLLFDLLAPTEKEPPRLSPIQNSPRSRLIGRVTG